MKIIRTLAEIYTKEDAEFLQTYGINVSEHQLKRLYFDEGDDYYAIFNYLSVRMKKESPYEYEQAINNQNRLFEYSIDDIRQSNYCRFRVPIGGGYPQPEDKYGYLFTTYDGSLCSECALPINQVNNFRVTKVSNRPLWGFTAWVFDVIFVHEEFYKQVFEPLGIGYRPVEKRSGKIRDGIVQLDLPIANEEMVPPIFYDERICPICGSKKYGCWGNYPYYPEPVSSGYNIFLTKEGYGKGWGTERHIIMSSNLALKLLELKAIKLEHLIPCRKDFEDFFKENPDLVPKRMTLTFDFKKREWVRRKES